MHLPRPLKGEGAEVNPLQPREVIVSLSSVRVLQKKFYADTSGGELLRLLTLQVCLHWRNSDPSREGRVSEARQTGHWVYSAAG